MTALIKVNPQLPAAIAKLMALAPSDLFSELTGGVTSGFPLVSYKGKVWRIRKGGEEVKHVDDDGNPMPNIDVVLVQAHPMPSKIFYDKKYEEGTTEPPRCFSNDGVKPDASVQSPISKQCASCPNNVWGSRISDSGKKTRACADARRMAVVFLSDIVKNGTDCQPHLLRVPAASLNPLKDYAEKVLAPKGIPFYGIVTRIGFNIEATHPQLTFKGIQFLNDEQADVIASLRGSEDIRRILAEAQEFPAQATADAGLEDEQASSAAAPVSPPSAKATSAGAGSPATAAPKKAAMRPATDEEAGLEIAAPAPPPPAVVADDEIAPAAPPKKAKAKPAAPVVAAPAEEEEESAPATVRAPAQTTDEFDSLLNSILNG